ncbi:MAG: hypothetical protein ACI4XS_14820 [Bacillus sp. (in: firmicutes)]
MFEKCPLLDDDLKQDLIDLEMLREAEQLREYYQFLQSNDKQEDKTFKMGKKHLEEALKSGTSRMKALNDQDEP